MATQIFSQKYQALPICSRTINNFVCLIDRVKSIVWFRVLPVIQGLVKKTFDF